MALCSFPSSRFILHSTNALALVSVTVQEASKFPDIKIVNFDWLTASINGQVRADESQFTFEQTNSNHDEDTSLTVPGPSKQDDNKEKGRKRPRSPTPVKEDPAESEDSVVQPPTKKHKDAQIAKSGSLFVPVDEMCPLSGTHRVYIDGDGMIYDAALNQTNVGANNNKFYRIQILVSNSGGYSTWTRWGRVGEEGTGKALGDGSLASAMHNFEKKFKEKAGVTWANRFEAPKGSRQKGYYTFIERKYDDDSSDDDAVDQEFASSSGSSKVGGRIRSVKREDSASSESVQRQDCTLPMAVQRLMELIFNQQFFADTMRELDYDANKLPLGKLSKRTLEKGFEILKDLGELLADPSVADSKHNMTYLDAISACSNQFFSVIPHAFGRSRPPVISSDEKLKKEIRLMESLSDMQIANTIMKDTGGNPAVSALDRQFTGLGLQELTPRKSCCISNTRSRSRPPFYFLVVCC